MASRKPLVGDPTTGVPTEITAPDTIDPTVLPVVTAVTQRTFAFFMAG